MEFLLRMISPLMCNANKFTICICICKKDKQATLERLKGEIQANEKKT